MAESKYEYVKKFETNDQLLPNTWIVVRVDGRGFSRFTKLHKYTKPNDQRGIALMNDVAQNLMTEFPDVLVAFGHSDEYSFVLKRNSTLYSRRSSKIATSIVSFFSSSFVFKWNDHFPDEPLQVMPQFDGRCVLYPAFRNVRDYFSWRQVDCHINNMYNTCFWNLIQRDGKTEREAKEILSPTNSKAKNELLFSRFGINYNNEPAVCKKGSTLYRCKKDVEHVRVLPETGEQVKFVRSKKVVVVCHEDIIQDGFWEAHWTDEQ